MLKNKELTFLILGGLVIRLLFYFFGAEIYYGNKNFYVSGDTYSFIAPIRNLIETGIFSTDLNEANGVVGRLPGYSFFLAPFYLLFGETTMMLKAVCWVQILLDVISIFLIYRITTIALKNNRTALITGILYAAYPFIIVWTPVVYAETLGIFITLLTIYIFVREKVKYRYLLMGITIAIGFFVRPQLLFLLPAFSLCFFLKEKRSFIKNVALLVLGFVIIYSTWPIRNYVNHDKAVLMRDITSMRSWQNDVLNFHKYVNSLQAGWEPQMTQLISNQEISFPEEAYSSNQDSIKLFKAINLSRSCSDGFASFMGKPKIIENNCTEETAKLWKELLNSQIQNHPVNYFLWVPLKGLKKALFKFNLVENWKSVKRPLSQKLMINALFLYRSILILLGLAGLILGLKAKKTTHLFLSILLYFLIWYIWLCFVTRYLEMRYFLPADVLLLIPAGYVITKGLDKIKKPTVT